MVKRAILIAAPCWKWATSAGGFDVAALDARIGLNGVNLPPGDLKPVPITAPRRRRTPPPATRRATPMSIVHPDQAVELAPAYWIGALDPHLRRFDIILSTANGTSYNAYLVRGEQGVAVIDTVKEAFADDFSSAGVRRPLRRNHHHRAQSPGARPQRRKLPELLRRAPMPACICPAARK